MVLTASRLPSRGGILEGRRCPMPEIVLTEEQARVLDEAIGIVAVLKPDGVMVGVLDPKEAALIAEAKRRLATPGPRFTSDQIRHHMAALQAEWDRLGGFDKDYMRRFLDELQAADPPAHHPLAGQP
jgi:hypothetical protein